MNIPADLQRGDELLYYSADLTDEVIAWKEGDALDADRVGHVEVYAGGAQSWASRNGLGVALYAFRPDGLVHVRRPILSFDALKRVDAWFQTMNGTPYGNNDNLADAGIRTSGKGVNCSHFAALLMAIGGCAQFDTGFPANEITPRDFLISRESYQIFP